MNNKPKLSVAMLATAESLRYVALELTRLERNRHPVVSGAAEVQVIVSNTAPVADALDALAQRLDIHK